MDGLDIGYWFVRNDIELLFNQSTSATKVDKRTQPYKVSFATFSFMENTGCVGRGVVK